MDGIGMPSKSGCIHKKYTITTSPTPYNRWLGNVECRVEIIRASAHRIGNVIRRASYLAMG